MSKRFIYISIIFIITASSILFFSIRYFNQQSIIENKVLSLIPENASVLIQFKNPDELYNKYFTQNIIFKKIISKDKHILADIIQKLDSVYHIVISQSIQIQDYSFHFAVYPDNKWLLGFSAYQTKDISKIKKIIEVLKYHCKEIEGNFFISDNLSELQKIHSSASTKNIMKEWMLIFSKNPTPLHIYQKKDTTELAYQINFQPRKIFINGFIKYKNTGVEKFHCTKTNIAHLFENINKLSITHFDIAEITTEDEYLNEFIRIIKKYSAFKQIQIPDVKLLPITNSEKIYEAIKPLADSAVQTDNILLFSIKRKYIPELASMLNFNADTMMYVALSENNLAITTHKNSIINNTDILMSDLSKSACYLVMLNNISPTDIENTGYFKHIPVPLKIQKDTLMYNFYSEIFSSDKNYFSFIMSIEKSIVNAGYLWTYQHNYSIQKILGVFDDHKTQLQFILLQDSLNNLITINSNGEILWTYTLESPVKSKVFNVDILKNNKHQILFNTAQKIYLIDRNGKNVGRFPIKFTSEITNPINVFDYDNNKNYRIWFSTRNYYTYNYTLDGKTAEQYRPYYFDEVITQPPYYTSIGPSDYIILITAKGKIIGISRKGDGRFILSHTLPLDISDYHFDIGNTLQNSYLYYCSKDGLKRISFSDDLKSIFEFKNQDIIDARFTYNNFDKSTQLAVLSSRQFLLYSLKGDELYSYSTDTNYTALHIQKSNTNTYFILSNNSYYTILQQNIDKDIQIIAQNIHSTTLPFITNIFNDNKDYIIYTEKNKVFCKKIVP